MPAGQLSTRPARLEDEEIVVGLMRDFYVEEHLVFDELIARRAIHELLGHPALGAILLLEADGVIVGHATVTFGFSLEFHGRYALLDELYLIPSTRGRGWGRRALELAAEVASASGTATLRLEVNHANVHARSVYLKAGFQDNRRDLFTKWLT